MRTIKTPVDLQVADRLKLLRKKHNMSQLALAKALDVSFQQVQKYETAYNKISVGTLHRCAQIFGVGLSYFFDEDVFKTNVEQELNKKLLQSRKNVLICLRLLSLPRKVQEDISHLMQDFTKLSQPLAREDEENCAKDENPKTSSG